MYPIIPLVAHCDPSPPSFFTFLTFPVPLSPTLPMISRLQETPERGGTQLVMLFERNQNSG